MSKQDKDYTGVGIGAGAVSGAILGAYNAPGIPAKLIAGTVLGAGGAISGGIAGKSLNKKDTPRQMDKQAVRYLLEKQAVSYKLVRDAARKRLDRFSTGSPRELHPLQKRTAEQTTRMLNNLDEAKVSVGAKRALEDLRWATKPSTYGQGTKFKIPSDKIIR